MVIKSLSVLALCVPLAAAVTGLPDRPHLSLLRVVGPLPVPAELPPGGGGEHSADAAEDLQTVRVVGGKAALLRPKVNQIKSKSQSKDQVQKSKSPLCFLHS